MTDTTDERFTEWDAQFRAETGKCVEDLLDPDGADLRAKERAMFSTAYQQQSAMMQALGMGNSAYAHAQAVALSGMSQSPLGGLSGGLGLYAQQQQMNQAPLGGWLGGLSNALGNPFKP